MKKIIIITIIMSCLFLLGCSDKEYAQAKQEAFHKKWKERYTESAIRIVKNYTIYVYDPEVDICYAITAPEGYGRTMTVVDYDKVKDKAVIVKR